MSHRALRLLLASVVVASIGCSEMRNDTGTISKRIGDIVRTPGATEVDLRTIPTFGWEYFYASKPGITREEVCSMIGAGRNVCGRIVRIAKAPDDHVYLLFGLNGQLTHIELHALANGHFDVEFPDGGLPKSRAVFKIQRAAIGTAHDTILLQAKDKPTQARSSPLRIVPRDDAYPFIEATANSRPRYGSCAFLPPRGLPSAAPHVER